MKIVVIGTGYVGLVAGACFADLGLNVVCVDTQKAKIDNLRKGVMPIYEPGLEDIVIRNHFETKTLKFTTSLEDALIGADVAFIAVGTPPSAQNGNIDMRYVHVVAREIGEYAKTDLVVINKSTVPVGTGDVVEKILRQASSNANFSVVSNPEFLREGMAIDDFKNPDRIIIGVEDDWGERTIREIYQNTGFGDAKILSTSRRSAELIKYASNAFLATKVTFINDICDLCEATGGTFSDVARGMGMDTRIGEKFLQASPGYGGSCFPKDTLAIAKTARDHNLRLSVIETVILANEDRKRRMASKILDGFSGEFAGKVVAVLGLTFKADTDDIRDSPAISIIRSLLEKGISVQAYDPKGMMNASEILPQISYYGDAYHAASGADLVAIVTEWQEFAELDLLQLKSKLRRAHIVDYRNMINPETAEQAGFKYLGVGFSTAQTPSKDHSELDATPEQVFDMS